MYEPNIDIFAGHQVYEPNIRCDVQAVKAEATRQAERRLQQFIADAVANDAEKDSAMVRHTPKEAQSTHHLPDPDSSQHLLPFTFFTFALLENVHLCKFMPGSRKYNEQPFCFKSACHIC